MSLNEMYNRRRKMDQAAKRIQIMTNVILFVSIVLLLTFCIGILGLIYFALNRAGLM